jgi:nicotinamide-nucleotide amidase
MTELPADLLDLAKDVLVAAKARDAKITTAESCTGGLISGCLTAIPGSSDVVECGFITYNDESKINMLGIPRDVIAEKGAVSDIVALAMAEGALAQSSANFAVAVTGITGPGGGTKDKPVGLVFLSQAETGQDSVVKRYIFAGTRTDVRRATVGAALELLLSRLTRE